MDGSWQRTETHLAPKLKLSANNASKRPFAQGWTAERKICATMVVVGVILSFLISLNFSRILKSHPQWQLTGTFCGCVPSVYHDVWVHSIDHVKIHRKVQGEEQRNSTIAKPGQPNPAKSGNPSHRRQHQIITRNTPTGSTPMEPLRYPPPP